MNNNNSLPKDEIEIDLLDIAGLLIKKSWIIILSMIIVGAILFSYSMFFIAPTYKASAKMYVNNSNISSDNISISSSELSAARGLLDVYIIILKTRMTLDKVIDKLELDYTYEELYEMVSAYSINDTEVFEITVTCTDPWEAKMIVDKIVEILPQRIADVVEGSSVSLVDHAVVPTVKAGPDCVKYAVMGFIIGAVLSFSAIVISPMLRKKER